MSESKQNRKTNFPLRFADAALRRKLEKAANQNGRSLNSEINQRLEKSLRKEALI